MLGAARLRSAVPGERAWFAPTARRQQLLVAATERLPLVSERRATPLDVGTVDAGQRAATLDDVRERVWAQFA
jgi:hypothetical protein